MPLLIPIYLSLLAQFQDHLAEIQQVKTSLCSLAWLRGAWVHLHAGEEGVDPTVWVWSRTAV